MLLFFGCEKQSVPIDDIDADKKAIQLIIDDHLIAVDSLDVDRIIEGQTEDHLNMVANMPPVFGKQAYIEYFTPLAEYFRNLKERELIFEADEFVVSDDWAFQLGHYTSTFKHQNDYVLKDEGNYLWIFKKENDGKWKWARVISNSTLPLRSE